MISIWSRLGGAASVVGAVAVLCAGVLGYEVGIMGQARAADSFAKDLVVGGLTIVDGQGTPRIRLYSIKSGPNVVLYDEKGTVRAGLSFAMGVSGLTLEDEKGTPRAGLTVAYGAAKLVLHDEEGTYRAGLAVTKDELGLALYDEKRTRRANFGSAQLEDTRTGATETLAPSSVMLWDKDGKRIWQAP